MLKYRKINNELLRVGRTAIAPPVLKKGVAIASPPLKEVRELAQRSMCIEGGCYLILISIKKHNNLIIRN